MIRIRPMTAQDVPLGMLLCQHAGFNQTPADWHRFLALDPDGCFVAEWEGQPAGTVTNSVFDRIGWIAMLLVHREFRSRGIGTRLMHHAMAYLQRRGVATLRLDATPMGRPIYEKLGLVADYELVRMEGVATGGPAPGAVRPARPQELDQILALDLQATGTRRGGLIERLYCERPGAMRVTSAGGPITGYLTSRPGTHATQIGPGVALDPDAGRALADAVFQHHHGHKVFVDIPVDNRPAIRWAESRGLTVQRPFTRMHRGEAVIDDPKTLWASSGPEKG